MEAITIKDNETFLRQVSTPIDFSNIKQIKNDIKMLEEYCKENEVMAMAAVQLGIPKEIINKLQTDESTEEENNYNEARVLINPVIIKREGLTKYWEACASCLDNVGLVKRPYRIFVEYYDINGNKQSEIFEGFESTVLSHEMDHLDGILHMDIAEEVLVMTQEERKKLRQKQGYSIINKQGDFEQASQVNKNTIKAK